MAHLNEDIVSLNNKTVQLLNMFTAFKAGRSSVKYGDLIDAVVSVLILYRTQVKSESISHSYDVDACIDAIQTLHTNTAQAKIGLARLDVDSLRNVIDTLMNLLQRKDLHEKEKENKEGTGARTEEK